MWAYTRKDLTDEEWRQGLQRLTATPLESIIGPATPQSVLATGVTYNSHSKAGTTAGEAIVFVPTDDTIYELTVTQVGTTWQVTSLDTRSAGSN